MPEARWEQTAPHRKSDLLGETEPDESYPSAEQTGESQSTVRRSAPATNKNRRRQKTPNVWRRVAGGLALTLAAGVGAAYLGNEYIVKPKQEHRIKELNDAHKKLVNTLSAEQSEGAHIQRLSGTVVLFDGSKLRTSTLVRNSSLFGRIPDNVASTVGSHQTAILKNPLIRDEGSIWLQATTVGKSANSAEKLAQNTVSVSISNLLHQHLAMVCNQGPDSYATVSEDFSGYVDPDGGTTATYSVTDSIDQKAFQELRADGLLPNCDYDLKP